MLEPDPQQLCLLDNMQAEEPPPEPEKASNEQKKKRGKAGRRLNFVHLPDHLPRKTVIIKLSRTQTLPVSNTWGGKDAVPEDRGE